MVSSCSGVTARQVASKSKSAAARALCRLGYNRGGRLCICPAKRFALVGHGDYKPILVNCEALMYFSIGAVAVFGRVDAGFDQCRFYLIDCFLVEVGCARDLLCGASSDQLSLVFDWYDQLENGGRTRFSAQRELVQIVLKQVEMRIRRGQAQ